MTNTQRLEWIVSKLPEAERVDIAEWGDHPSFRVRGKNFIFSDAEAEHLTIKISREEAAAVVASDPATSLAGYGLGRHGWIDVSIPPIRGVTDGGRSPSGYEPPTPSSPPRISPAPC